MYQKFSSIKRVPWRQPSLVDDGAASVSSVYIIIGLAVYFLEEVGEGSSEWWGRVGIGTYMYLDALNNMSLGALSKGVRRQGA